VFAFLLNRPTTSDPPTSACRFASHVSRAPLLQKVEPNGLESPPSAFVVWAMHRAPSPMARSAP